MNRTIYIGNPAYLKCQHNQLKIIEPTSKKEKGSIPIEDIAFLVLDHPQITLSHYLMAELISARAAVISCNSSHIPHSIQLPFAGHTEHTERILLQSTMSEPLKKQLWKQTIEEKIHNQGRVLEFIDAKASILFTLMHEVKSGDSTNREGVAAKFYWEQLFEDFTRERYGEEPNQLLNYGYAILRAIMARALCSAGFHLALGIHHRSKYNPTCLADDIMEPYRPYVDRLILSYLEETNGQYEITKDAKAYLLQLFKQDVRIDGKTRPLQIACTITAASFWKCIKGEQRMLRYPCM